MVKHSKGLGKNCIFFVCSLQKRLIYFFKIHFVVFDCEPIISNTDIFNFVLFVDERFSINVFPDKLADEKDIFINLHTHLSLKDGEKISWAKKAVPIIIKQEKTHHMTLPEWNILKPVADGLELLIIKIGFNLVEVLIRIKRTDEPEGECFAKYRGNIVFKDVSSHQWIFYLKRHLSKL